MDDEDVPPERIWLEDEELSDHFDRVKRRHDAKASGKTYDEVPDWTEEQRETVVQNPLTAGLKRK